jgi:hypothetical protein
MHKPNRSPSDLADASPQAFELGGAAASLYDIFAKVGLYFFTFLIGAPRSRRPLLRNSRVVAGGAISVGFVCGLCSGIINEFNQHKIYGHWYFDEFFAPFCVAAILGVIVGIAGAVGLLWYVEELRNEALHELWLIAMEEASGRAEAEVIVDNLRGVRRSRYYREFFLAIDRGQERTDAHASAIRRSAPTPSTQKPPSR